MNALFKNRLLLRHSALITFLLLWMANMILNVIGLGEGSKTWHTANYWYTIYKLSLSYFPRKWKPYFQFLCKFVFCLPTTPTYSAPGMGKGPASFVMQGLLFPHTGFCHTAVNNEETSSSCSKAWSLHSNRSLASIGSSTVIFWNFSSHSFWEKGFLGSPGGK